MTPCALCHLDFDIHISSDDEVQVVDLYFNENIEGYCDVVANNDN